MGASGRQPTSLRIEAIARFMLEPEPQINPHLERPPATDPMERFLTRLFLRR